MAIATILPDSSIHKAKFSSIAISNDISNFGNQSDHEQYKVEKERVGGREKNRH